jgi:hypothetical protein
MTFLAAEVNCLVQFHPEREDFFCVWRLSWQSVWRCRYAPPPRLPKCQRYGWEELWAQSQM